MQNGPQYYLQTYLSMTSGNWVTKLYILGLSLYFIVALTAQRFPFPAYKPAFRPGLFAFSAFVTKHNSLARETAYLLSPKKKLSQSWQKKIFPLRGIPIGKPFLAILRFKNHLRLLQTFEQTIEQPTSFPGSFILGVGRWKTLGTRLEGTFPLQPSLLLCQPRSQGLLRFQDGGREKTLAHTVIPPAKYSKNRGVFCHVTQ